MSVGIPDERAVELGLLIFIYGICLVMIAMGLSAPLSGECVVGHDRATRLVESRLGLGPVGGREDGARRVGSGKLGC
jgi:hypothetical protein